MLKISSKIFKKEFENNYHSIGKLWILHQCRWLINLLRDIEDQTKLEISLYLLYHFLRYNNDNISYDDLISNEELEIVNLKYSQIHKLINLPKERVRRKFNELCKNNLIEKRNKKIFLKKKLLEKLKLLNQTNDFSKYFFILLKHIKKNQIEIDLIQTNVKKKFAQFLFYFYEFQLFFIDTQKKSLTSLKLNSLKVIIICGTVMMCQILNNKKFKSEYFADFSKTNFKIFNKQDVVGVSASSISEITNLPRATVSRICKFLHKKKILEINKLKHYHLSEKAIRLFNNNQKIIVKKKYIFLINIFKLIDNKKLV